LLGWQIRIGLLRPVASMLICRRQLGAAAEQRDRGRRGTAHRERQTTDQRLPGALGLELERRTPGRPDRRGIRLARRASAALLDRMRNLVPHAKQGIRIAPSADEDGLLDRDGLGAADAAIVRPKRDVPSVLTECLLQPFSEGSMRIRSQLADAAL